LATELVNNCNRTIAIRRNIKLLAGVDWLTPWIQRGQVSSLTNW